MEVAHHESNCSLWPTRLRIGTISFKAEYTEVSELTWKIRLRALLCFEPNDRLLHFLNYSQPFLLGLHLRGPKVNSYYPADPSWRGGRHCQCGRALALLQVDFVS